MQNNYSDASDYTHAIPLENNWILSSGNGTAKDLPCAGQGAIPASHVLAVDGLRGIAALTVVIYHLYGWSKAPEWRPILNLNVLRPLHDGWTGVNLFLILSGFCLYWPHVRDPARQIVYAPFMIRRVRRIVPAYYASLAFATLAFYALRSLSVETQGEGVPRGAGDIILHLFLLQSFSSRAFYSWNSVTWSLGLEWTWYLCFPAAVWTFKRFGPFRAIGIFSVATLFWRCGAFLALGPSVYLPDYLCSTIRNFLPGRIFEFALGMFIAWLIGSRPIPGRVTIPLMILLPLMLLTGHMMTFVDPWFPVRDFIYGIAFFSLLLLAVGVHDNPIKRCCEAPWLRSVGEASYSLYLFHMPLAAAVAGSLTLAGMERGQCFFVSLLSLPLIVLCARLLYLTIEAPFLKGRDASLGSAGDRGVR